MSVAAQTVRLLPTRTERRKKRGQKGLSPSVALFAAIAFLVIDTLLLPWLHGSKNASLLKKMNDRSTSSSKSKLQSLISDDISLAADAPRNATRHEGQVVPKSRQHEVSKSSSKEETVVAPAAVRLHADVEGGDIARKKHESSERRILGPSEDRTASTFVGDVDKVLEDPSNSAIEDRVVDKVDEEELQLRRMQREDEEASSAKAEKAKQQEVHEEEEGEEIEVQGWIYVCEIATVIVLSLLFEAGENNVRENLEEQEKEVALEILDSCFGELTILGFIGLAVFISTKTGAAEDLAKKIFDGYHGGGENPLAESFENVHMCIFCVMMVFMLQAATLMHISEQLDRIWDRWENMTPKGHANSLEAHLQHHGYLDKDGKMKDAFTTVSFQERMWQLDSHKMLIIWHALRHIFIYPVTLEDERKKLGSTEVEVKDPASFDFRMYLNSKMGEFLIDLVEVDIKTWFFSLLVVVPFVSIATSVDPTVIMALQTMMGILFSGVFVFLLRDLTRIEYSLSPQMSEDAADWLSHMAESWAETRSKNGGGRKMMTLDVEGSGRVKGGLLSDDLDPELRAKLLGQSFSTHEALLAPIHKTRCMKKLQEEKKRASCASRDEYILESREEWKQYTRPWHVLWLGGDPDYVPHEHDQLFTFHEKGIEVLHQVMRTMMFLEAILVASLIVVFFVFDKTPVGWLLFGLSVVQWPVQLFLLLPKIITKFTIVSSIECYKDAGLIRKVMQSVRVRRLREAVGMMQMVKLRGRLARLVEQKRGSQRVSTVQNLGDPVEEEDMLGRRNSGMLNDLKDMLGEGENGPPSMMRNSQWLGDDDDDDDEKMNTGRPRDGITARQQAEWEALMLGTSAPLVSFADQDEHIDLEKGQGLNADALNQLNAQEKPAQKKEGEASAAAPTRIATSMRISTTSSCASRVDNAFAGITLLKSDKRHGSAAIVLEAEGRISEKNFKQLVHKYRKFKEEKQRHIERAFAHMDIHHTGAISVAELRQLFNKMNILPNSDVHQSAEQLIHLFDLDNDGEINFEEFKALMVLAYEPGDPKEEVKDFDRFFDLIDEDGSDSLSYQELAQCCKDFFGLPLSTSDLGEMVYHCFRTVKAELSRDDFVVFMRWLQDVDGGPMKEERMEVERSSGEEYVAEEIETKADEGDGTAPLADVASPTNMGNGRIGAEGEAADPNDNDPMMEGGQEQDYTTGYDLEFGDLKMDRIRITKQGLPEPLLWIQEREKEMEFKRRLTEQGVPVPRQWGASWHLPDAQLLKVVQREEDV
ncbi:unnamed protein product [Amoebophrya sp. A25]|nr:unnamed protein product [Amoebophrya sp. A25]|eukprot:GSA25T00001208001.1